MDALLTSDRIWIPCLWHGRCVSRANLALLITYVHMCFPPNSVRSWVYMAHSFADMPTSCVTEPRPLR